MSHSAGTGTPVEVTSPGRVLWPAAAFTKRQMLDYLEAVAEVMLPHLANRPVTLRRFPEGVDGPGWYQTECRGAPSGVRTVHVRGARGPGQHYCRIEDVDALQRAANRGALEFHPLPTTVDRLGEAGWLVLDIDPGPPASLRAASEVALLLRDRLARDGLEGGVKTSGSLGLHVVVPLAPGQSFTRSKAYARSLAAALAQERPELVVDRADRTLRAGKVFVDWVANDLVRSVVAAYSLRTLPLPFVSTPLHWSEVEEAARADVARLRFLPDVVVRRVLADGDLFAKALAPGSMLPPEAETA